MQEGGQSYLIMPVSKACHSEMEKNWTSTEKCKYLRSPWISRLFFFPASHIDQSTVIVSSHSWAFSHSEFQFTRERTEMSETKKETLLPVAA